MLVPNFEAISRVSLVLEPKNRPSSLAEKAVSVKNSLSMAKNISLDYFFFHPLLAAMSFFFQNLVRSSKPQNIEI